MLVEHRGDRKFQLNTVELLDAASIHPEMAVSTSTSLLCAEQEFTIPTLVIAAPLYEVLIAHLLLVRSLHM